MEEWSCFLLRSAGRCARAAFHLKVTLAVNAWWDDPYSWFSQSSGSLGSQGSQASNQGFEVVWVNYAYKNLQPAVPGGPALSADMRVEVALQAIAKALGAGGIVIIFCKRGIHRSGSLSILVMAIIQWVLMRRMLRGSATWEAILQDQYIQFGQCRGLSEQTIERAKGDYWAELWDTLQENFGHCKWARLANVWDGISFKSQGSQGSEESQHVEVAEPSQVPEGSQGSEGSQHVAGAKKPFAGARPKQMPKGSVDLEVREKGPKDNSKEAAKKSKEASKGSQVSQGSPANKKEVEAKPKESQADISNEASKGSGVPQERQAKEREVPKTMQKQEGQEAKPKESQGGTASQARGRLKRRCHVLRRCMFKCVNLLFFYCDFLGY